MGRQFFEATVPELVRQVARLANGVERVAAALEAQAEADPEDAEDRDTGEVVP
jgi:hypothetical protein